MLYGVPWCWWKITYGKTIPAYKQKIKSNRGTCIGEANEIKPQDFQDKLICFEVDYVVHLFNKLAHTAFWSIFFFTFC